MKNSKTVFDPIVLEPPYIGIPTFFRLPYTKDLSKLDIALVGVPFDGGVTNSAGARYGPRAIRSQSSITGGYNHYNKIIPSYVCNIADTGDVIFNNLYNLEESLKDIEEFYKNITKAGVTPVSAGGDHSITYPILKAVGAKQPLALIHFDSHCDTAGDIKGSRFQHGSPFLNAAKAGVIDPKKTIQIGIRGNSEPLWEFSYESGMRVIHIEEFYELGWKKVVEEIRRIVGGAPAYITFDIDFLDPAFAPGTGTPEVGGPTSFEAQQLIRGLRGLNLVGADIVEVAPQLDPAITTSLTAANIMFEMLCVISDALVAKKNDNTLTG